MHVHPQALVLGRLLAANGIIEALGDEQRIVEFLCAVIGHIPGVKAVHACLYGERLPSAPPWENPCRNCRRLADTGESCCTLNTLPGAHLYYLRASFRSQGVIGVLTGGDAGFEFADPHVHNAVVTAATVMENRRLVRTIERESAERFERLVSSVPGVFYRRVFRGEWLHDFLGRRISDITGYPATDCMLGGRHELGGLLDPEDRAWLRDRLSAAAAERRGFEASYRVLHADRTVRWVCDRGCPVFDEDGRLESIEGFLNDITENKRIQRALEESRARYRSLVEDLQEVVFQTDAAGRCTFLNPAWQEITGYSSEESLGTPLFQYLCPDDRPHGLAFFQSLIEGHESTGRSEIRVRTKANGDRWIEARARVSRDPEGEPAGISGTFIDITDRRRSEAALRYSEERLRRVLDALPMATYTCDADGLITYFNACGVDLWGRSPRLGDSEDRFCGPLRLFLPDGTPLSHDRCWMAVAIERRAIHGEEVLIERPDGSRRTVLAHANPLYDRAGRLTGTVNVLVDITEQKAIEEALRESNERFQLVTRVTTDSVWDWDIRGNTLRQYNHFDSSIGDRSTGSGEIPWTERVHPDDRERVMDGVFAAIEGEESAWSDEYRLGRRDGSYAQVEDRGFIIRDGQGRAVRMVGATLDITERKGRDPLTGLPNRALLLDRLTQTLARAEREQRHSAVLFLDLDRFKAINDSLGHAVGDELLRQAAERLCTGIRKEDTVARIGGDEFVIVMAEIGDAENAAGIASKVLAALCVPFVIEEYELSVSTSCGIAISPADGTEAPVLLQRADTALYQCKADGGGGYRLFDPEMDRRAHARLQLEQGLRRAIERGEFLLHYQAQIEVASGTLTGAEALVRWQHPEGRLVSPGEFIPLAEDMGCIGAIGEWVLREACAEAVRWPPALRVSVNVSARQLTRPDFTATVREILEDTGLPPGRLEIEITESALMSDPARSIATLEELQELGIQIALDDFGTGYSSLGQLKRLPLQRLKIDKSFVQDVPEDPNEVVIVEAILGLARQLNRIVVAEGVETESQLAFLRERGCDEAQGYLIAKPVPAAEFRALLKGTNFLRRELPTDSQ